MSASTPVIHDPSENPATVQQASPGLFRRRACEVVLQLSQRLGAIALFATIGTWAMMFMIRDFHVPLAVACGCADAGLCSALIARMCAATDAATRREANGVAIFNLVLFVLALYLMIFARLEVIRAAASDFFTPTPPTATHG